MFSILLIIHLLGYAAGVGTSLFMAGLAARAEKLSESEGRIAMGAASTTAGYLSGISIVLIWLSGIGMLVIVPGLVKSGGVPFWLKVALTILLTLFVGMIHRANARIRRNEDIQAAEARIKPLAMAVLLIGVSNAILAVYAFH
jgi:hypothetical protein